MYKQILRRAGVILLAAGVIDMVVTTVRIATSGPYPAALDLIAIASGLCLLLGGPRAGLWVRTIASFLLAAGVALIVALPVYQPLDLTLTEIRLDPTAAISKATPLVIALLVAFWVARELGRRPVLDAITAAGIRRWDMRLPAQAGCGVVALASLLLWLALHGQSAQLAEQLALEQLGPGYRYHLSWISWGRSDHGTLVSGEVTAWNRREVKQVLLHWETR